MLQEISQSAGSPGHDVPSGQIEETRDNMGPAYPQFGTSILIPSRPSAEVCLGVQWALS